MDGAVSLAFLTFTKNHVKKIAVTYLYYLQCYVFVLKGNFATF